jgi:hypothetical protein
MNKKMSPGKALGWSLLLCTIIGGIGTLIAYEPDFQGTPILGLVIVWTLTLAIGIASFRNALRKNWVSSFIVMFNLSTLFLSSAIHALGPYLSGWFWIIFLSGIYVLVWVLPLLKPHLARVISNEQIGPRTWLGKHLIPIVLVIGISSAIVIGKISYSHKGFVQPAMLIIGTMSAILAVGLGQYFAVQVVEQREIEIRERMIE